MKEASYYTKLDQNKVKCQLCPHNCTLSEGKMGNCKVRKNQKGVLYSENYGKLCSVHLDPIEKKPLYHYLPSRNILSVGSVGCNLSCKFCQNWQISQSSVGEYGYLKSYSPEEIVQVALKYKENIGIAYTYNEPIVWYEYMNDIALLAKEKGLKNIMVTNGFINLEPLENLINVIDAFSVDLKAFTEDFYKKLTSAKLDPVKNSLKLIKKNNKHLEITNLIIPEMNDDEKDFENLVNWIFTELGSDTVLHLSRYFPTYKLSIPATPVSKLNQLYNISIKYLPYTYLGNVTDTKGKNTICPNCGKTIIKRHGYFTNVTGIDNTGKCKYCGHNTGIEC
jgi:pyruvate formate lyase activating enzyme